MDNRGRGPIGRPRACEETGAAVLETALVSIVLLLLFAGAVDVGRMFYSYVVITNAAREGVRTAARLPCTSLTGDNVHDAIVAAARSETNSLAGEPSASVTVGIDPDPATKCYTAGQSVIVTVTYDYQNILTQLVGSGFEMANSANMVAFGNDQLEAPK